MFKLMPVSLAVVASVLLAQPSLSAKKKAPNPPKCEKKETKKECYKRLGIPWGKGSGVVTSEPKGPDPNEDPISIEPD